jgi:hypothetical protein
VSFFGNQTDLLLNMATSNILRIVSKDKPSQQVFLDIDPSTLPPLKPSSVRIHTQLIGLSAGSIAYCALGDDLGWWNSFPIPEQAPSDYKDGRWGVAPSWGYAVVVQSTISNLKEGTWLWGHMPTAACPFDLELKQSNTTPAHWQAIGERRTANLYNRFIAVNSNSVDLASNIAGFATSLKSTFESAYLLNRWVFALRGEQSVHPAPGTGSRWSAADSDLTSTLVICLAAGSRTGRAFLHQLAVGRPAEERPASIVEVTEDSDGALRGIEPSFSHHRLSYEQLQSFQLTSLIRTLSFKRVVVMEIGGRGNALSIVMEQLQGHSPDVERVIIGVGTEQNAQTTTELRAKVGLVLQQGAFFFSTASLNEAAIKVIGETAYYQQLNEAFKTMIESELARNKGSASEGKVLGISLDERYGVRGDNGLEGAWNDLFSGKAVGSRGLVVDLQAGKAGCVGSQM